MLRGHKFDPHSERAQRKNMILGRLRDEKIKAKVFESFKKTESEKKERVRGEREGERERERVWAR